MRSYLTPRIFRRLLSQKGLTFRCPHQSPLSTRYQARNYLRNASLSLIRPPTRRTLFGFSKKPPRQPKDPELDPGLSKMLDLMLMDEIQARPPPPHELVKAWRTFFAYKDKKGEAVNRIKAEHVVRTLLYLKKNGTEENDSALSDELKLAR